MAVGNQAFEAGERKTCLLVQVQVHVVRLRQEKRALGAVEIGVDRHRRDHQRAERGARPVVGAVEGRSGGDVVLFLADEVLLEQRPGAESHEAVGGHLAAVLDHAVDVLGDQLAGRIDRAGGVELGLPERR